MQPTSRMLLAASALAALLAPAIQAQLGGAHVQTKASGINAKARDFGANARSLLPVGSGVGFGVWIAPTDTAGFASADLYDTAGHRRYEMRANLLPATPSLPGEDEQGGFLGTLLGYDASGQKKAIAGVSGKWIRHAGGMGEFGLDIVVDTGDRNQPFKSVGQIDGALLVNAIPAPDMDPYDDVPPTRGNLALQWVIDQE